tara:strand:+ start:527 stop:715 length:189 start_codon:yes stop_codon:yes gene_type:complete
MVWWKGRSMYDKKILISLSEVQHDAITDAARKMGLSFTAFVRVAAIGMAADQGIEVKQPRAD